MPSYDFEPRLLRAFATTADTLHFTRAAARLYVAQQALSRDIRRLEGQLGVELFERTTRRVQLTAEGERLLPYALRVLAAHEELSAAFTPVARPLLVDVRAPVSTASRVLAEARESGPDLELVARFHSGLTAAATEILAGRLDVSFGRAAGLQPAVLAGLDHQRVRYEPMAVLLPQDHPLADRHRIPVAALTGQTLYTAAGNAATAEWTSLAEQLFDGRGITPLAPFPEIDGQEEFVRLVRKHQWAVLATTEFTNVPGFTLHPLIDPVPLAPVSMIWRRGLRHPGLDALVHTIRTLTADGRWLHRPEDSWLPEADAHLMSGGLRPVPHTPSSNAP